MSSYNSLSDEETDVSVKSSLGILFEKGYTGIQDDIRSSTPQKILWRGLSNANKKRNFDLSSDQIIVEYLFGRMGTL